jgi:hypothetical protein
MTRDDDAREAALQQLNLRVGHVVEHGALSLLEAGGVNGYAAGLRSIIFTSLNKLDGLDAPERRHDLELIIAYCERLLEEDEPSTE